MAALRLFSSNRLELLAEDLAEVLASPLASPFDEEIIIVQSNGMARWLCLELARHHRICANCRFPFPNAFVYEIFRKVVEDLPEHSPFDPEILTWKIVQLLPSLSKRRGFEPLRHYLGERCDQLKLCQLAERIADTFDQYLLFRPEMVLGWERGEEHHWQAVLWRELVRREGRRHRAALGKALLGRLQKADSPIPGLPARVSVFGISALPRFHLQVLAGISRLSQVNLFLMNPCREYWGDILPERTIRRILDREREEGLGPQELHLESGNSLLASMGTLGRHFFSLVNELDCEEKARFVDPGEESLLSSIQSDILNLRDGPGDGGGRRTLQPQDTSVQIHSCHSPMREIEVLKDRLLDMFEKDPELLPKDILVMAPDIETYAPYIQAVFAAAASHGQHIPFSIADRSMRQESEIADTFLRILDLASARFTALEVLAILESPAVRLKFGLSAPDLELIFRWVRDTRIRWGVDEQNRAALGLPAFSDNSWKAGLERLLLGYAMPGAGRAMFADILPYDEIEGGDALVLGRFLAFIEELFSQVASLARPRRLDQWAESLSEILDRFFLAEEASENEMLAIRRQVRELGELAARSALAEELEIKVIRWYLGSHLQRQGFGAGFITGAVTFCAMLPMRSIPFKVVCLVGLDAEAYPRQSRPPSFDLMASQPQPGDRSRRFDDRYLFLEAILSARKCLYISYVGQSIQDNSARPPSVLVSELIDYIEKRFEVPGREISAHLITRHRLQPFSPEYFKKSDRLFSYSRENFQAAQHLLAADRAAVPFISTGLSEPQLQWRTVDLDDLSNFWSNPSRFLLRNRLGIYLEETEEVLVETETFEVRALERYLLAQTLLERKVAGEELAGLLRLVRASGQLPPGAVGECTYENLARGVEVFVGRIETYLCQETLAPLEVEVETAGFRVTGKIAGIYRQRLLRYRYARARARDHLGLWLQHLALNVMAAPGYPRTSLLVALHPRTGQPCLWEYGPLDEAAAILAELLKYYWRGLQRPLAFFPESSWEYASRLLKKGSSVREALAKARSSWAGSDFHRGEGADPYYQLCFGQTDPLDTEFEHLAVGIFEPLLRQQKEIGEGPAR